MANGSLKMDDADKAGHAESVSVAGCQLKAMRSEESLFLCS